MNYLGCVGSNVGLLERNINGPRPIYQNSCGVQKYNRKFQINKKQKKETKSVSLALFACVNLYKQSLFPFLVKARSSLLLQKSTTVISSSYLRYSYLSPSPHP